MASGIQVPIIQRAGPTETPSVGRTDLQVPNYSNAVAPQTEALNSLVSHQVSFYQKQLDNSIDTNAKNAANEYNIYLNEELNKAKLYQGDPTKVYSQFEDTKLKKYQEILDRNPDLGNRGKIAVQSALGEVSSNYALKSSTAYAGQYYDYDKNVTDSAVKLAAQDLITASSLIDPTDESSFKGVDAIVNRIGNLYRQHGEKFGAVTRDENGNQVSTDSINLQIAQSTSEGLVSSINNLSNSGRPDLAEAMYGKYYKYIDVKKQDDLQKTIKSQKDQISIENAVQKTIGMPPSQAEDYLNKTFAKDPGVKDKAFEALDTRTRHIQNFEDRTSNKNFLSAYNLISAKMDGENPYQSVFEMEADRGVRGYLAGITKVNELKSLKEMIKQPKESNQAVKNNFFTLFSNGDLKGMSPDELNKNLTGLNKEDRKASENLWKKYNAPQTTAEEIRTMNNISSKLVPQLQSVGYVRKDDFNKYSNSDQVKITQAQDELIGELDKLPANTSYKDQLQFIKSFAAKKKSGEVFGAQTETPGIATLGNVKSNTATSTLGNVKFNVAPVIDERSKKINAIKLFIKDNKRAPIPGSTELEDYRKKNGL